MSFFEQRLRQIRAAENKDLVKRYKNGEVHAVIDAEALFWPPRPVIQKDKEAIKKLYGDT